MSLQFEWDDAKAAANLKKHGVAFDEALSVFADPVARIFDDPDHSEDDPREVIVGVSAKPRLLVVGFTAVRSRQTYSRTPRDEIRARTP